MIRPFGQQFGLLIDRVATQPAAFRNFAMGGNRLFVEAVIWKFRSCAPWRDLPERFVGWKNTHTRFSRWAEICVFYNIFKELADDPDNEYAMIDVEPVERRRHCLSGQWRDNGNSE